MRRVVITGLGIVSPLGIGMEEHWAALVASRSAIARSRRLAEQGFPIDIVAEIPDLALQKHFHRLPRKQIKLYSRVTLLAMLSSSLAVEDAGLENGATDPARTGVFLGTFFTGFEFSVFLRWMAAAESKQYSQTIDLPKASEYCISSINPLDYSLKTMPNLTAGHIAIAHNAQGFCRVIADGCTAGLHAVGQAFLSIKEQELDVAICGGAEAPLEEFVFINLCTLDFLARGGEEPGKVCNPFDESRRGAVLGEGAGIMVLEEFEHARQRGARIYGEVLGYGSVAGNAMISRQSSELSPEHKVERIKERLSLSMRSALLESGLEQVDLIGANGDSTRTHDAAEAWAIQEVFGSSAKKIPVCATKSLHGHLISASGVTELMTCLLALKRGIIPPTINLRRPDPQCDLYFVSQEPRPWPDKRTALVSAVGLSGESASVVARTVNGE